MRYHIYYHDDFDGMASSALMLDFLRSCGDDIISYNPIDYTPKINETWVRYKFKTPFVLVDFRYHPKASWWFDHHKSSFTKPALSSWQKLYKNDKTHQHNSNFPSCASLVLTHLIKYFHYKPPVHVKELIRWSDIIDGARYKSVADAIESRGPAMKIRVYTNFEKNKNHRIGLIKELSLKPMAEVVKSSRIDQKVKLGMEKDKLILEKLKKISDVLDKVTFVDGVKNFLKTSHFMVYYVFPSTIYSVVLETMSSGYHLRVGFNHWQKEKRRVDISKISEKYGGGGHKTVGAIEKKSKKEIMQIAEEIIEYLNKHG